MTALSAGQLTRRILLQARTSTQDSYGAQQTVWTDLASVWAAIEPLTGNALTSAQQIASEVTHRILMRYQPILADTRVSSTYRALYKGRIFNIHASLNEEEGNAIVVLFASEGLNDG